ncbi:D-Ala-D-Ala carboxypeptidase family metallohydrolase, partial [Parabacteroides sp. OttesenSCG-928-J18]|nr:D-Ala-D-Ala carboxypeptidase family metallohydrolase [Parabacteroides sp. OttesenSCG-928-J18]
RLGIENRPGTEAMTNMERLVRELLQPLRELYGKPIRISSGYRSVALNRTVGGAANSQHLKGEAADCTVKEAAELLDVLKNSGLVFDQAILYRKRNFLHLSLKKEGNRNWIVDNG